MTHDLPASRIGPHRAAPAPRFAYSRVYRYTFLQEVFDRIWDEFVWHKAPRAQSLRGTCVYTSNSGCRCFIGTCLDFTTAMRWNAKGSLKDLPVSELLEHFELAFIPLAALDELTTIHDGFTGTDDEWSSYCEASLRSFASRWGLRIPGVLYRVRRTVKGLLS